MTKTNEETIEAKKAIDVAEVAEEQAVPLPDPVNFKVVVTNTVNGIEGEIFNRECPFDNKLNTMKASRQRLRDMGVTVRNAVQSTVMDGTTQILTIKFTDAVISEKAETVRRVSGQSNARKSANATEANETDSEIFGIAKDKETPEGDRREALLKYNRHALIRAFNTHCEDEEAKLSHYSTKIIAVDALLA